jgi:hypothetical protein
MLHFLCQLFQSYLFATLDVQHLVCSTWCAALGAQHLVRSTWCTVLGAQHFNETIDVEPVSLGCNFVVVGVLIFYVLTKYNFDH